MNESIVMTGIIERGRHQVLLANEARWITHTQWTFLIVMATCVLRKKPTLYVQEHWYTKSIESYGKIVERLRKQLGLKEIIQSNGAGGYALKVESVHIDQSLWDLPRGILSKILGDELREAYSADLKHSAVSHLQ